MQPAVLACFVHMLCPGLQPQMLLPPQSAWCCRRGEAVTVFDGRPNSELILATGRVEDDSPADHLTVSVGLVPADRMFSTKKEILKNLGFEAVQVLS